MSFDILDNCTIAGAHRNEIDLQMQTSAGEQ